ncbi:Dna2-domain-containing protein [Trametopsis cervina]|nr:Dna2-domain-containing protein [Trametopsis cervina]
MSPKKHSEMEESAFMADLLAGIDDSFFDAVPSPDRSVRTLRTPVKSSRSSHSVSRSSLIEVKCTVGTPTKPKLKTGEHESVENIQALLEGAEHWDWDDMNSDFMTPQKRKYNGPINYPRSVFLLGIPSLGDERAYRSLIVAVQASSEYRRIILQDDWLELDVRIGDVINVIGTFSPPSHLDPATQASTSTLPLPDALPYITLTSQPTSDLLVLHPDILITATSLSSTPTCLRKPILSTLIHSSSDVTPALVWGNMLHEIMQSCLIDWTHGAAGWDEREMDRKVDQEVKRGLGDLLRLNVTVDQAKRELKIRAVGLKAFQQRYIHDVPKSDAVLTNTRAERGQSSLLAINKLHDIEEDIWSPTYGLKGKLDVSVQAIIEDTITNTTNNHTHPTPLELKTGRSTQVMEHRAQTLLYTLLMEERYATPVPSGLLYYTQSDEVVRVPRSTNEIRALIRKRNEMAGYLMRRAGVDIQGQNRTKRGSKDVEDFLPPTIDDARVCGRCYVVDTCMLYRKAVEQVQDTASPISDIYALKTSHISPSHAEFFKTWEHLISLEEHDLMRFRKELWTMTAKERETHGRCFADMLLDESYRPNTSTPKPTLKREGRIHQFTYRFVKANIHNHGDSLLNGHMSEGDAVTVSVEPDLLALVRGFIVSLTPSEVVIGVDHELSIGTITARRPHLVKDGSPVIFRVDKDELFGGMGRIRGNLAALFHADGDTKRLELVVDLRTPRFTEIPAGPLLPSHEPVAKVIALLNTNQQAAVRKVISTLDYSLILGMPGTGKTTVIAAIIHLLVYLGKSVLLTSYTHSAVDTILLKLKDVTDFKILRLGNPDKVHPDVHKLTLSALTAATTIEQLENQVMSPPVVATTCLSIDHREAKRGGLDVSLFRRLSEAHPEAVIDLNEQYRMNEDIMLLSNKLIYNDRLRCGSKSVASRSLRLPNPSFLDVMHASYHSPPCHPDSCWIEQLLDANCKAVFVDTDDVPAKDSRVGDLTQNTTEAALVYQVVEGLVGCGVSEEKIGVITLYRQQIKLLSHLLQDRPGIEVLTADRSQGRDKDCVVISMVRSNDLGQVGDLLKDWRRINVSFTRARSKLIIFGSRSTLQAEPLLQTFFELMDSRGWILRLRENADKLHFSAMDAETPRKRSVEDVEDHDGPSSPQTPSRQTKKLKNGNVDIGLLRGRPILRDLLNDTS